MSRKEIRLRLIAAIVVVTICAAFPFVASQYYAEQPTEVATMQREFKSLSPADKNTCMAYTLEIFSTPDRTHSLIISPPLDDNGRNRHFNVIIYDVNNDVAYTVRMPNQDINANLNTGHYIVSVTNLSGAPLASTGGYLSVRDGSHFRISFVNVWCDRISPPFDMDM